MELTNDNYNFFLRNNDNYNENQLLKIKIKYINNTKDSNKTLHIVSKKKKKTRCTSV